jgi:hypothetical protein
MNESEEVAITMLRLNARAWGIAAGLLAGLSLFAITNFLVFRGGPNMGQHLSLLSIFLPGYTVSVVGSMIGFVYAFVFGYFFGRLVGGLYNQFSTFLS